MKSKFQSDLVIGSLVTNGVFNTWLPADDKLSAAIIIDTTLSGYYRRKRN